MLKTYFKIAWRNLVKNRASSFINIGGLALGMAVAMLIGIWIYDELSFNKFHKNYDRIAQVMWHTNINGERLTYPYNPAAMGPELRRYYVGDFKYVAMSTFTDSKVLTNGDKKISRMGNYMEPEALEMLSVELLKGNKSGLKDPHSIMISESVSKVFFGEADPIGKVMKIDNTGITRNDNNTENLKVTGVYKDLPFNSDFKDIFFILPWQLLLFETPGFKDPSNWDYNIFQVLVQLADHADMKKVSAKIQDVRVRKMSKERVHTMKPVVFLQPMSKWHLYSEFKNGVNVGGRIQYVRMFGIIGAFVLLLACINFMNLSTARSEKRAKEVGIRKTIGSSRRQIITQFFSESLLVAAFAFVLSLILVRLSLPFFNAIADKKMTISWGNPVFWFLNIGLCAFVGLFAGLYPALYLSSIQTIRVLKGTYRVGRLAALPRKVLVVLQFTVSVVLIIATLVVFRQIKFAKDRPIGYNRNRLITVGSTLDIEKHFSMIRNELKKSGAIEEMGGSINSTTDLYADVIDINWRGKNPNSSTDFALNNISYEYGKTIGWQIKEGRDFSPAFITDSSAFILNESAVKVMGLQHPIGEKIEMRGKPFTVIGVIKDIVFESPYKQVMPYIFCVNTDNYYLTVTMKISPEMSINKALAEIATIFRKENPSFPFDYKFVDQEYARKFSDEERIGRLAGFFTVLAIFISCLGLFGLASFVAEQRIKEIGIRKVLGATVLNLWSLQSKDFAALVFISLIISIPLAYYFMHNWLQNYLYRTEITWWIFASAGIGSFLITLLTVSFQAIKAAIANPVKSLRPE
jgi:putative ABC transport system permease protein